MKKFLKNWSILTVSSVLNTLLSFISFIIIGRKLSIEEYADFNAYIALVITFATFASNVASGTILNKEVSEHPKSAKKIFNKFMFIRIIIICICSIILYFYRKGSNNNIHTLLIIALMTTEIFSDAVTQFSFGLKNTMNNAITSIIFYILWLVAVLMFMPVKNGLTIIFAIYVIISILKVVLYHFMNNRILINIEIDNSYDISYRKILKDSSYYLWMRTIGLISGELPILLLDGYSSSLETANYSVGSRFTKPIIILFTTLTSAIFPFLINLFNNCYDKFKKIVDQLINMTFFVSSLFAAVITITSAYWLPFIMGEKYEYAVVSTNFQIWHAVILGVDTLISIILSASNKHRVLAIITTVNSLFLLPFLFIFVENGAYALTLIKFLVAVACFISNLTIIIILFKLRVANFLKTTFCFACFCFVSIFLNVTMIAKIIIFIIILFIYIFSFRKELLLMYKSVKEKIR